MHDIKELHVKRIKALETLGEAIASARILALDVYNNDVTSDQIKAKTEWLLKCAVAVLNLNKQIALMEAPDADA